MYACVKRKGSIQKATQLLSTPDSAPSAAQNTSQNRASRVRHMKARVEDAFAHAVRHHLPAGPHSVVHDCMGECVGEAIMQSATTLTQQVHTALRRSQQIKQAPRRAQGSSRARAQGSSPIPPDPRADTSARAEPHRARRESPSRAKQRRVARARTTEGSRVRGVSVEGYPRTRSPRQGRHPHLPIAVNGLGWAGLGAPQVSGVLGRPHQVAWA